MNRWQLLQQVRYLVRSATWPDAPAEAIFASASVIITNSPIREGLLYELRYPAAIVSDAGKRDHAEHPELGTATVALTILVQHFGDGWGTATLLGANRVTTAGTSLHRGLLEVFPTVLNKLLRVGHEAGVSLSLAGESDAAPVKLKDDLVLLGKEFTLSAWVNDGAGAYPSVTGLAASVAGSTVTVSWTPPPARWDLLTRAVSVVRKSGSAPASITDGTLVADGTTATSLADTPSAGTYHYGAAAKFDELAGTRFSTTLVTKGPVTVV